MTGQTLVGVLVDETRPVETGIWCPSCLLPSAIEVPILLTLIDATGSHRPSPASFTACPDCGESIPYEPPEVA